MSPLWVVAPAVPSATVRRLSCAPDEAPVPVQVAVPVVPVPQVVPRQVDPLGLRLRALESEVESLRAQLQHLQSA